ncbi:MAG: A24 family peptidase [Planctomycetota bacterium]|jgi:prepilin peptidase CpaA
MTVQESFQLASFVALFLLLIVSAYTDITRNKVYNWCTFPGIGIGLALAYLGGGFSEPEYNLVTSLFGLLAGGGIILFFSLFGGIGLGDVKLMAAVGALAGFPFILWCLLYSSLIGFVIAIGLLIWKGRVREGLLRSVKFAFRLKKAEREGKRAGTTVEGAGEEARRKPDTIPFGAAIAFGTLWAFFLTVPKT